MNMFSIDLKTIDGFNNLNKKLKYKIMCNFNLCRYKFLLDELKDIHKTVTDINTKKIIEIKINKLFKEGCNNFYIINSEYNCDIYLNGKYHLYFNNETKKYFLFLIKKKLNNDNNANGNLDYEGYYTLGNDLIWKKVID